MTSKQWKTLMAAWSKDVLGTNLVEHLETGERGIKYLGFEGASEDVVKGLEKKLGVELPPSYREFLKVTNGFRVITPFIYRLRPAEEVDWFVVENQGWAETYAAMEDGVDGGTKRGRKYFDYAGGKNGDFRAKELYGMLQISDVGDGVMLLNPQAVTPDGEWEAWFFANWVPGAERYASFAHMMVETYGSMRALEKLPGKADVPAVKVPGPEVKRRKVITVLEKFETAKPKPKLKRKRKSVWQMIEKMAAAKEEKEGRAPAQLMALLNELKNPEAKAREKASEKLLGGLKGRFMAVRHPDLVPTVAELARTLEDPAARAACVCLLTEITPEGPVPEWLLAALADGHEWVQGAGVQAVSYFKGPELVEPIIEVLKKEKDWQAVKSAAGALGELGDARAIGPVAARLEEAMPEIPGIEKIPAAMRAGALKQFSRQYFCDMADSLAKCGPAAAGALRALLSHADPLRREAGILGLRVMGDRESWEVVARLKKDPDAEVRKQAEMCAGFWGG